MPNNKEVMGFLISTHFTQAAILFLLIKKLPKGARVASG